LLFHVIIEKYGGFIVDRFHLDHEARNNRSSGIFMKIPLLENNDSIKEFWLDLRLTEKNKFISDSSTFKNKRRE